MSGQVKHISIKIPTRTYLKKFIQYKLGETFFSDGPHHIQKYLTALLEKKTVYNYNFKALNNQYRDQLTIFLTKSSYIKAGFSIKQEHVVDFNNYIEFLFDEDLVNFCHDYLKFHNVAKEAVKQFAEHYNIKLGERQARALFRTDPLLQDARAAFAKKLGLVIEEDITDEALKKMEYRARARRKKSADIFSQPVPQVSKSSMRFLFQ